MNSFPRYTFPAGLPCLPWGRALPVPKGAEGYKLSKSLGIGAAFSIPGEEVWELRKG